MSIDWISRAQEVSSRVRNCIGGRSREGRGDPIEKFSPRDGSLIYQFAAGEPADVDEAVTSARVAVNDGRWSRMPIARRKDVLRRLASLIEDHAEELALLECMEVGKPITAALQFDVPMAAASLKVCAELADKVYGDVYAVDASSLAYQMRRPIGVVAGIIGWNFPLLLAISKVGPALATGNSVVLKPSELTPLSAARLADLAAEAGVPDGVLNVVHGGPNLGAALGSHPDVDLVSFTGSTHTGKRLLIAAGESNMKRLLLECGGKAPNIVFDDSPPLEAVADSIVQRALWNQGQVCTASSRLLIHEGIKQDLIPLIVQRVSALRPGDPLRIETQFGALVSEGHRQKVMGYIDRGEKEGARVLFRPHLQAPIKGGFYVSPVIFDNVGTNQRIAREEIFGPVLSVMSFRNEEDAIQMANDTIYGLSAIVWTRDLGRAHRVTHGLKAGSITVNATATPLGGAGIGVMSVGGHKESGLGVEGGIDGFKEYTSSSAVQYFV